MNRIRRLVSLWKFVLLAGVPLLPQRATADDVVCIEEDWELQILQPDPNQQAPQVTTIISPSGDLDGIYAAFDLNHQTLPQFRGGGMQLQLWHGESAEHCQNAATNASLSTEGETITWTTRMIAVGGYLAFQVKNGQSETWGPFGGDDMTLLLESSVSNLNHYDAAVSQSNSGIGFASNRVQTLKLNPS